MNKREVSKLYDQYHDLKEKILLLKECLELSGWQITITEETIDWPVKKFPTIEMRGISKNQQCEIVSCSSPWSYENLIGHVAGHYKQYFDKWKDTPVNISLERSVTEIRDILDKMLTKDWFHRIKNGEDLHVDYNYHKRS